MASGLYGLPLVLLGILLLLAIKLYSDSTFENRSIAINSDGISVSGIGAYRNTLTELSVKQDGTFMVKGLALLMEGAEMPYQYNLYFASVLEYKNAVRVHSGMVSAGKGMVPFAARAIYDRHMFNGKYCMGKNCTPEGVIKGNKFVRPSSLTAAGLCRPGRINALVMGNDGRVLQLAGILPYRGNALLLGRITNGSIEALQC